MPVSLEGSADGLAWLLAVWKDQVYGSPRHHGLLQLLRSSAVSVISVLTSDDYLLRYEAGQREQENAIRREARNALARRGVIATESEIRKWKAEQAAIMAEKAAAAIEAVDIMEEEGVEAGSVARLRVAQEEWEEAKDRSEGRVLDELRKSGTSDGKGEGQA